MQQNADLANEVSSPGGRPIGELAASFTKVHRLLQFGPVQLLLTALIPTDGGGGGGRAETLRYNK